MEKIDFFGGTHGNFLELMINLFIHQIDFKSDSIFNDNGACHLKDSQEQYVPIIRCGHYSSYSAHLKHRFNDDDSVIEIHCDPDSMLPALVNSLTRANDEVIDLVDLEHSTIAKLSSLPKAKLFLDDLVKEFGIRTNYPRSIIRNYFYSKFDSPELGLNQFNEFIHTGRKMTFPFGAFFNLEQFYLEMNKCAFFLGMNFYPTTRTFALWEEFISRNQGYASMVKCNNIMSHILSNQSYPTTDLTLVEEAWILHRLSLIYRFYDPSLLAADTFPANATDIYRIVSKWKEGDYPLL